MAGRYTANELAALTHAEVLIELAFQHGIDTVVALAHPRSWHQGALYVQAENPYTRALGYTIMLTALLETPDAAVRLVASVRDGVQGVFDEVDSDAA